MKQTHPARPHVVEALRLVREGLHLSAQHAIQRAGYLCTVGLHPADLGTKGEMLRVMNLHAHAAWMSDPEGGDQHVRRPADSIDVEPTIRALCDVLAGTAVHA